MPGPLGSQRCGSCCSENSGRRKSNLTALFGSIFQKCKKCKICDLILILKIWQSPWKIEMVPRNQNVAISKLSGNCPGDPIKQEALEAIRRLTLVWKKSTRVFILKKSKNRQQSSPRRRNIMLKGQICKGSGKLWFGGSKKSKNIKYWNHLKFFTIYMIFAYFSQMFVNRGISEKSSPGKIHRLLETLRAYLLGPDHGCLVFIFAPSAILIVWVGAEI